MTDKGHDDSPSIAKRTDPSRGLEAMERGWG